MNLSAKPTNKTFDVVHRMRWFNFNWCHQIIDERASSFARVPVNLQRAWQVTNDRLCKFSSQNRVRNFILSIYLHSRVVTVVKQRDGNNDGSACATLRSQHGEGALRDGSIRKRRSQPLKCAHKRFVRTEVRLTPIRNNV